MREPGDFDPERKFRFSAPIETIDWGRMAYQVVYFPDDLIDQLPFKRYPQLRIEGSIGGAPFQGACQSLKGRRYLILSKRLLKEADVGIGNRITVAFTIADQNAVDLPPELAAELTRRENLRKAWEKLTPGRRRGLVHPLASAKRRETREKRLLDLIDEVMDMAGE
ncbi:MAG: YdeI/OmpD-associated family protein [Verrucomicrobiota bacterium]